jgi:hypothetical protein
MRMAASLSSKISVVIYMDSADQITSTCPFRVSLYALKIYRMGRLVSEEGRYLLSGQWYSKKSRDLPEAVPGALSLSG